MAGGRKLVDTIPYRRWLAGRLESADELHSPSWIRNHPEGEFDAEIMLCCVLGASAADIWPGDGIDRVRYVQFLVNYAQVRPPITMISIPFLGRVFGIPDRQNSPDPSALAAWKLAARAALNGLTIGHARYRDHGELTW